VATGFSGCTAATVYDTYTAIISGKTYTAHDTAVVTLKSNSVSAVTANFTFPGLIMTDLLAGQTITMVRFLSSYQIWINLIELE